MMKGVVENLLPYLFIGIAVTLWWGWNILPISSSTPLFEPSPLEVESKKNLQQKIEKEQKEEEERTRAGTEVLTRLMAEVKDYVEKGDVGQALLSLKEILRHDPENERVKLLLSKLGVHENSESSHQTEIQKQFEELEKLYLTGRTLRDRGDLVGAYPVFREAVKKLESASIRPTFAESLRGAASEVGGELEKRWDPRIEVIRQSVTGVPAVKIGRNRLQEAGHILTQALVEVPGSQLARETSQIVFLKLEELVQPLWIRAQTLSQLEGCRAVTGLYQQVKGEVLFPETQLWQEADRAQKSCEKGLVK